MNIPDSLKEQLEKAKEKINQQQSSEEYQQLCEELRSECDRLTQIAQKLYERSPTLAQQCNAHTARREFASGSTLHRGFYCPSPVIDLIVGNIHRGKIMKRITSRSNPSHEYGFDENGRLMWCRTYYNRKPATTEYLIYETDAVYGITLAPGHYPQTITEERYENGRIVQYLHGLLLPSNGNFSCTQINGELFAYDNDGLLSCEMRSIHLPLELGETLEALRDFVGLLPQTPLCRRDKYFFHRENGYLVRYTSGNHQYRVLTRRKA